MHDTHEKRYVALASLLELRAWELDLRIALEGVARSPKNTAVSSLLLAQLLLASLFSLAHGCPLFLRRCLTVLLERPLLETPDTDAESRLFLFFPFRSHSRALLSTAPLQATLCLEG